MQKSTDDIELTGITNNPEHARMMWQIWGDYRKERNKLVAAKNSTTPATPAKTTPTVNTASFFNNQPPAKVMPAPLAPLATRPVNHLPSKETVKQPAPSKNTPVLAEFKLLQEGMVLKHATDLQKRQQPLAQETTFVVVPPEEAEKGLSSKLLGKR